MPDMLLRTKLFVPPARPNLVPRPALIARLNQGLAPGFKLAYIAAPAGFGKTALMGAWVQQLEAGVGAGWLALDQEDGDLTRFLAYLIAALNEAIGADGPLGERALGLLHGGAPAADVLTALINELATRPGRLVLVLDDYHAVESAVVDEALDFLLQNLPEALHVAIAAREDPHLSLARLRARGQLVELRAADLRFTAAEAGQFLRGTMGLDLDEQAILALEGRTEGWIAGLQLAAISLQGRDDIAAHIEAFTGSHRFVLDYLLAEVLQQQPAPVQEFLLVTAVLDRLTGSLCDALTGREDGQEMLDALERANLFLVPLDGERRWYRYHHLFAELLREQLRRQDAQQMPDLHRRAAAWYEAAGMRPQAIAHALAASDWVRAAELAEQTWREMDLTFQFAPWLRWVQTLPEGVVRERPLLATQFAWALNDNGSFAEAARWLDQAEAALALGGEAQTAAGDERQPESLPALIALARANQAQYQGLPAGTIRHAERALRLLPPDDHLRRNQATALLGIAHWSAGELEAARRAFAAWISSMERAGNLFFAVASGFALADVLVEQGRLRDAIRACDQSFRLAGAHGEPLQALTAHHHLGLAMIYFEMDDQAAYERHLATSMQLGELTPLINWRHRLRLAEAYAREFAGELDEALRLLDEARRCYVPDPVPDMRPLDALQARIAIRQGRLEAAEAWAQERGLFSNAEVQYLNAFAHITLARLLLARGAGDGSLPDRGQALAMLARVQDAAAAGGHGRHLLETRLLLALAHEASGDRPAALQALGAALALAEPQGYVRTFTIEGLPMARLLSAANAAGLYPAYTAVLLSAFPAPVGEQTAASPRQRANAELPEPLSPRELEVLDLIAGGLTNHEIAGRLVLAPSTVKVHIRNIYAKLDAHHRAEAIARAHALGLLPQN